MASMRAKLQAARALSGALRFPNVRSSALRLRAELGDRIYPYVVDDHGKVFQHEKGQLKELRR